MFVKICGTTSQEDALLAVALGADAVGFIFAPSTRQVAAARVATIVPELPDDVLTVGVFKDEHPRRVIDVVRQAGLGAAQLHGRVSADDLAVVRSEVPIVIRAFGADDPALARAADLEVDYVLVDAPTPGSGRTFDWDLVGDLVDRQRVLLAGGLHPDNVANAVRTVGPFGVDVATGVESAPGRKDPVKLRRFIERARATIAAPTAPDGT